MASSEVKAKPGSDVTTAGEETLHFDDDTSKGKEIMLFSYQKSLDWKPVQCYSQPRSRVNDIFEI